MVINKMIRKLNERNAGIWILSGLLLCIVSCGDEQGYKKETLPPSTLTEATPLAIDTIALDLDSFYLANKFFVYHDSIMIIVNGNSEKKEFLDVYNLNNMQCIASYFKYGNGHGEMLSANVDLNGNCLFVNDFQKAQFAFVNLDSVTASPNTYAPRIKKHKIYDSPSAVPYGDKYLVENPYCYYDAEAEIVQGVEQGVPRFIVTDGTEEVVDNSSKYSVNPRNVAVDGRIVCKPDGEGFVYASFGQSNVEFYDKDLNLKKIVEGPVDLKIKYNSIDFDETSQKNIIYDKKIPYCYLSSACDENYVYLMYLGEFYENDIRHKPTYIFKFDWKGNFIKGYKSEQYLSRISKGTEEDVFYATAINEDGLPYLIKLYVK